MSSFSFEQFENQIDVSRETLDKFSTYKNLLVKWQKSINLVSNTTINDIWRRHLYDSAQLVDYLPALPENPVILDLGSGAGFPGLVLSTMGVGKVHLVEAVGKKCAFMKQVIRELKLDAEVHNERIEDMNIFPVDLITSRACADLDKLLELTSEFIGHSTHCLFLKGGKAEEEIENAQKKWSFKVKKHASKSEESGMILLLSDIKKRTVSK